MRLWCRSCKEIDYDGGGHLRGINVLCGDHALLHMLQRCHSLPKSPWNVVCGHQKDVSMITQVEDLHLETQSP